MFDVIKLDISSSSKKIVIKKRNPPPQTLDNFDAIKAKVFFLQKITASSFNLEKLVEGSSVAGQGDQMGTSGLFIEAESIFWVIDSYHGKYNTSNFFDVIFSTLCKIRSTIRRKKTSNDSSTRYYKASL